jgi:hypothetical protein
MSALDRGNHQQTWSELTIDKDIIIKKLHVGLTGHTLLLRPHGSAHSSKPLYTIPYLKNIMMTSAAGLKKAASKKDHTRLLPSPPLLNPSSGLHYTFLRSEGCMTLARREEERRVI